MTQKPKESGMDELRRLSRQTADAGQKMREEEKQKADYEKNMQGVVAGLRGISFSVALNQLKTIATPDIFDKVTAMQQQPDSKELRRLISDIARNLERDTAKASKNNPELESISNSSKTLAILISLLFSLQ
jgi:hypothetical protein